MAITGTKQVKVTCGSCGKDIVITPITFGYGEIGYCPCCRGIIHDFVIKNGREVQKGDYGQKTS
jgi:Zn-finger nucleic acid-binding protein